MSDVIRPIIEGSGTSNGCAWVAYGNERHMKITPCGETQIPSGQIFQDLDNRYLLHYQGGIYAPIGPSGQWEIATLSSQIDLYLEQGGTYNFTVDWADGNTDTITAYNDADLPHTYDTPDTYVISVQGTYNGTPLHPGTSLGISTQLKKIHDWGPWKNDTASGLYNNINLTKVPNYKPENNLQGFNNLFRNCINLDDVPADGFDNLKQWDVSDIKDFNYCFYDCDWSSQAFGENWNVAAATGMRGMFGRTNITDVTLSGWDVSNVTDFGFMFQNVTQAAFANIAFENWNTSSATTMDNMFANTQMDRDLSTWDFRNLTAGGLAGFRFNSNAGQGMSTANYDALLARWVEQAPLMPVMTGIAVGVGTNYSAAGAANRLILTDTYNWTITQDGVEV